MSIAAVLCALRNNIDLFVKQLSLLDGESFNKRQEQQEEAEWFLAIDNAEFALIFPEEATEQPKTSAARMSLAN